MVSFSNQTRLVQVATALIILFIATCDTLQPNPRVDSSNYKLNKLSQYEPERRLTYDQQNEIEEYRIQIQEPYKSIIQSTIRVAIIQTKLTNHVSVETTLSLLNEVGFYLSKPSTLLKVGEIIAYSIATFLVTFFTTSFLFPGFIDAIWRDPMNALKLDKYLINGVSEGSVLKILHSRLDETLSRFGLYDNSCRERTICHGADLIKQMFPEAAEKATKFAYEHHIMSNFNNNKYFKAFSHGFFDRNCSAIASNLNSDPESPDNCLGHVLNTILQSRLSAAYQPKTNKYQTIKVGRA